MKKILLFLGLIILLTSCRPVLVITFGDIITIGIIAICLLVVIIIFAGYFIEGFCQWIKKLFKLK